MAGGIFWEAHSGRWVGAQVASPRWNLLRSHALLRRNLPLLIAHTAMVEDLPRQERRVSEVRKHHTGHPAARVAQCVEKVRVQARWPAPGPPSPFSGNAFLETNKGVRTSV